MLSVSRSDPWFIPYAFVLLSIGPTEGFDSSHFASLRFERQQHHVMVKRCTLNHRSFCTGDGFAQGQETPF